MIQVKANNGNPNGFRRCGYRFTNDWQTFEDGHFSKAQLNALEAEPNVAVRKVAVRKAEKVEAAAETVKKQPETKGKK